jgi:DNA-binding HxlR family transcriptional regulator
MPVPMRKNRVTPPPTECPLTECMRVIGGAWKPHIIWNLRDAPRRFSELRRDVHGISAKMLTARLVELQQIIAAIVDVGHRLKMRNRHT